MTTLSRSLTVIVPALILTTVSAAPAQAAWPRVSFLEPKVTVLDFGNAAQGCAGGKDAQYNTGVDDNGTSVNWTYANGSHRCLEVGYQPYSRREACTYSFYVPKGNLATGQINFHFEYGNARPSRGNDVVTLDEGPVWSWRVIARRAGVTRIWFGDDNGQRHPAKIGWGRSAAWSIKQECPA